MLHAGLDLSRRKIDVCLLSSVGEIVDEWASPADADGLRGLAARASMWGARVRGVVESMNGARFVHDRRPRIAPAFLGRAFTRCATPARRCSSTPAPARWASSAGWPITRPRSPSMPTATCSATISARIST
jgi:hypothetical protein